MMDATARTVLRSMRGDEDLASLYSLDLTRKGRALLSWQEAHKVANLGAAQAHGRLRVDLTGTRIDVLAAINSAGIVLMWRRMPTLFGAYLNEPGASPGILLNSGLPPGARRHTAAHELGHAWLEHSTSVDDGSSIDTVFRDEMDAIPPAGRKRSWPDQEKTAEAFAAWFLMPRRVVTSALAVLGLTRPRSPADVYRLSLLLGTSYRSTLRHLPNLRLASRSSCANWASTAPAKIKATLDAGAPPPASRRTDVWVVNSAFNGATVELQSGDRVVIEHSPAEGFHAPPWLRELASTASGAQDGRSILEVADLEAAKDGALHGGDGWRIHLRALPPPAGLDSRGQP